MDANGGKEVKSVVQLYKEANILKKSDKVEEAFELYKKIVEIDPNYANAYFGMANCQKYFKNYESALNY